MFKEWKAIFKKPTFIIVMIGISLIPALYNIIFLSSMWDPYGKLSELPVAIVISLALHHARNQAIKQDLIDEMWKVAQRELATGFYYGTPSENEQLFGARRKIPEYKFVAEVVAYDAATQTATIRQRNVINEGDQVEFYGPGFRHFETFIEDLHDAKGNKIDRAPNPMELLTIKVPQPVEAGDMVRALKEGLINLYKEDGTSVTVRA